MHSTFYSLFLLIPNALLNIITLSFPPPLQHPPIRSSLTCSSILILLVHTLFSYLPV
ncbi:hypothetical protein HD806DRAFT_474563, partial [Xylariaceae sp. AK1471]